MLSLTVTEYNEIEDYVTRYHEQPVEVARFLSDNPEFIKFLPHDDHRINMILMIVSLSEFSIAKYLSEDDLTDPDISKAIVSKFPCDIKHVNQTKELCILAVRQNALALEHVNNKTKEVCEEAVMKDPKVIQFVPECEYYKELVELAETFSKNTSNVSRSYNGGIIMKNNEFRSIDEIIRFLNNDNLIDVVKMIDRCPEYMKYVDGTRRKDIIMMVLFTSPVIMGFPFTKQDLSDPDIAAAMVCNYPYSIRDVRQTEELCLSAVRKDGRVLEFVNSKTRSVCLEAIVQCPWALKFVPSTEPFYQSLAELAVRLDPDTIRLVDPTDQTENMQRVALVNPRNIEYVSLTPHQLEKYSSGLIRQDPDLVWMFPNKAEEAVNADGTIIAAIHPSLRTKDVCRAAVFSWDVDNIIPFIPMQYRDEIVNEFIDRIKYASGLDESSKYYGFVTPYGYGDEYDEDDDSCDDDENTETEE